MKKPLLLDTDILVDFLRGHPKAVAFVRAHSEKIVLSTIVVAELYAGAKDDEEARVLDALLSLFRVVPVTEELAKAGGRFKQVYHKSHGLGLADALIAATAEAENAELKTLNVKHFPMFKRLKPPYSKR